ncbi:aldehyde dehydrogenase family 22 member A1 [Klebsormidium nitens]|uniref:Aldehyde dehydrogenase family 22 member A1 n=1 Tax=Klebsormidium nitens TaxID=105231 RepID=A0A1Y1I6E9_KLENI|nr:aldehyde dehydrogenase family 22 member A1 [Klebsormidium nitens]|eukprot:GAQ84711.1 aldehyde dehydrogenase family 22 member A1 [Klebsormidium nitens]
MRPLSFGGYDMDPHGVGLLFLGAVGGALLLPLLRLLKWLVTSFWEESVPLIEVGTEKVDRVEKSKRVENHYIYVPRKKDEHPNRVNCYDPATMEYLGFVPALNAESVRAHVEKARAAQKEWCKSSFAVRRRLLRVLLRYIVENQEIICRISARDSGKVMVDAGLGEVLTTCEKIAWLLSEGERWLRPERRSVGRTMLHKVARVEYEPLGVLGAIVPWNYPFHNLFNPVLAGVFAGNAVVVKVSEHTSWSAGFYQSIIHKALETVGAPHDLVHIVTGYGATGQALVESGVNKLTFVGSTAVGKKVMAAAAETLTPVVLELGGKDPFVVCDDADLEQVVSIALRGAFQGSGQNCAGAERFYVQEGIYTEFVDRVVGSVNTMRVGPALERGHSDVDMGAVCMPTHVDHLQSLVDEAVAAGAKVLAGGTPLPEIGGHFYPPTVLVNVNHGMRIMQDEVFGPIMCIMRFDTDDKAVELANDCRFGLGSSVFSGSKRRARAIASRIRAGMVSINDFNATYMCQSLPFGGVGDSGFDRFAGVEGLRGCCSVKSIAEDRFSFVKTYIPKPIQYPVSSSGFQFLQALVGLFYGAGLRRKVSAGWALVQCMLPPPKAVETQAKTKGSKKAK